MQKLIIEVALNENLMRDDHPKVPITPDEIAQDAYKEYRMDHGPEQLQADLQALASAPKSEVHQACEEAANLEAGDAPLHLRLALVSYRDQLPAAPAGAAPPRRPEDLLCFLPDGKEAAAVTVAGAKKTYTLRGLLAAGDVFRNREIVRIQAQTLDPFRIPGRQMHQPIPPAPGQRRRRGIDRIGVVVDDVALHDRFARIEDLPEIGELQPVAVHGDL